LNKGEKQRMTKTDIEQITFGPCHPRQKMVLQAEDDVLLVGGGEIDASTLITLS